MSYQLYVTGGYGFTESILPSLLHPSEAASSTLDYFSRAYQGSCCSMTPLGINSQAQHDFAQSDGSGVVVLVLLVLTVVTMVVFSQFHFGRRNRAHKLKATLRRDDSVRDLTPYEQLRIKDCFDREIQTRHLEDYQNKTGDVEREVFYIEGSAEQHSFNTIRGVAYSFQTIADLEMLVPTAAIPYLRDENNHVEFVMVGSLAFVIKLNEAFELVNAKSEKDQSEPSRTVLGDSNVSTKLDPLSVLDSHSPSNSLQYLKNVKGDRLLVSADRESGVDLQFILGIYWLIIFLICGFGPLVIIVLGVLTGNAEGSLEMGYGMFLYLWPWGEFFYGRCRLLLFFGSFASWYPIGITSLFLIKRKSRCFFGVNRRRPSGLTGKIFMHWSKRQSG